MPSGDDPSFCSTSSRGSVFKSSFASGFTPTEGFVLLDFAGSTSDLWSGGGNVGVLRFAVFAPARGLVANGPVIKRVLRRRPVGFFPPPNIQGRLQDGAGKGEGEGPGQFVFEPDIHGVQPGRGLFGGLSARKKRDSRHRGGHRPQKTQHRGISRLVHLFL